MGLDVYISSVRNSADLPDTTDKPESLPIIQHDVAYWRNNWKIQEWASNLYGSHAGKSESFNGVSVRLKRWDLDSLRLTTPESTAFGELAIAHTALDNGNALYITSFW